MSATVRIAVAGLIAGVIGLAAKNRRMFDGVVEDGKIDVRRLRDNVEKASSDIDGKVDQMFSDAVTRFSDGIEEIEKFLKNGFGGTASADAKEQDAGSGTAPVETATDVGSAGSASEQTVSSAPKKSSGKVAKAAQATEKPAAAKAAKSGKKPKTATAKAAKSGKDTAAVQAPVETASDASTDDATIAAIREAAATTEAVDIPTGKPAAATRRKPKTSAAASPARQAPVRRRSNGKSGAGQEAGNAGV